MTSVSRLKAAQLLQLLSLAWGGAWGHEHHFPFGTLACHLSVHREQAARDARREWVVSGKYRSLDCLKGRWFPKPQLFKPPCYVKHNNVKSTKSLATIERHWSLNDQKWIQNPTCSDLEVFLQHLPLAQCTSSLQPWLRTWHMHILSHTVTPCNANKTSRVTSAQI